MNSVIATGRYFLIPLAAAMAMLSSGCERTPEDYDYHGGTPDIPEQDSLQPTDWSGDRLVDIIAADGTQTDQVTPDAASDSFDIDTLDVSDPGSPVKSPFIRECKVKLEFTSPDGSAPYVAGEFTNWADGQLPMSDADSNGVWELDLDLTGYEPGSYGYKFHTQADNWYLDPKNPMSKWVGTIENSKLLVPDCKLPELALESFDVDAGSGTVNAKVKVLDHQSSTGLLPGTATLMVNGKKHAQSFYVPSQGYFDIKLKGLKTGSKVTLRLAISNSHGESAHLYVPLWLEEGDWSWRDASMYFAFTDRFANGDPTNDSPSTCTDATSSTNWHGGDFKGILKKIEEGWFDKLGVNVLWISPVIDNPNGCYGGTIAGVSYTAYHGYFPLDIEATEEHYGSMEELKELVQAAHDRGMRVLFDFVANHVHEDCPIWTQHSSDGWFHPLYTCEPNWDKPIECWFQPYLPDLDYTNDAVVEMTTQNAIYWILETGVDGFRVDAVKHMVHNFMRTLRYKIDKQIVTTGIPFYMVGETFMGEWGGGQGEAETVIKEYVNPQELDGQFDFPFYWQLLRAVGRNEGDFQGFASFLNESKGYYGKDALMVSFMGNHDVPRFISHAAGDIADQWGNGSKEQGLYTPPPQPGDETPYKKHSLAIGLLFTMPEIPLVYYGDEIALAGAGDPDNRRDMSFDGLSGNQQKVLEFARKVGLIRLENPVLRRGGMVILKAEKDLLVFERSHEGKKVVVLANRASTTLEASVNVPGLADGTLKDYISDKSHEIKGGNLVLQLEPYGLAILGQ